MDRAQRVNFTNRILVIMCTLLAAFRAAPDVKYPETDKEFKMVWDAPRTPKELDAVKFTANDTLLQAKPLEHGYRFSFVPDAANVELDNTTRYFMLVDFEITDGRGMNRVFVEVIEVDKSLEGIPFNGFHYNNLAPLRGLKKSMEVPIPLEMMEIWATKEAAQISFILKFEFGMLSYVKNVTAKVPVLIFTRSARPKCSQHTCCLTANTIVEMDREHYPTLVQPVAALLQRCVECVRASEPYHYDMATFRMFIHEGVTEKEIPEPAQLGQCRASEWSSMQTIFKSLSGNVLVRDVPYFNPEACECVEDFVPDYERVQNELEHKWRLNHIRGKNWKGKEPFNATIDGIE